MKPLIITVAGIGAELTRADQPHLPMTPKEIAEDAARCREAGAAIYHLHVRDDAGRPTMEVERFRVVRDAIAAASDVIVQFTTGGAVGDDPESRMAPIELRPEMATLTTGSVNFGDDVFSNPRPFIERLYARMLELGVVPEFEIFEAGMIATAQRLADDLGASHHRHFDFVLGVPGAMPAWGDAVAYLAAHLPGAATWSATGIGRHHLDVAVAAIDAGGHVRTGMEDVRFYEPGRVVASNRQLVDRVVAIAAERDRRPVEPDEARVLLGLDGPRAVPSA